MSLQDINATNSIPGNAKTSKACCINRELLKIITGHYHTIIIDCGPIGFVDSMGMATLDKVLVTAVSTVV